MGDAGVEGRRGLRHPSERRGGATPDDDGDGYPPGWQRLHVPGALAAGHAGRGGVLQERWDIADGVEGDGAVGTLRPPDLDGNGLSKRSLRHQDRKSFLGDLATFARKVSFYAGVVLFCSVVME